MRSHMKHNVAYEDADVDSDPDPSPEMFEMPNRDARIREADKTRRHKQPSTTLRAPPRALSDISLVTGIKALSVRNIVKL